jgi:hypothetical protein
MKNLPLKYGIIMLRRGFVPVVVIIALALLAIFGGTTIIAWRTTLLDSYLPQTVKEFLGKEKSGSGATSVTSDTSKPSLQDSETTVEDPTKDWKTYTTNTELGFSFKYPAGWKESTNQTGVISLESADGEVVLGAYKDFQGGFEHWSSIEDRNYYTADGVWIPTTIMYGEDDPSTVTVSAGTYDAPLDLTFLYSFNKASYPEGLYILELILSSVKFF